MQNGEQVWTTRVVTGKPGNHATPMLTETMKFITVNPTWNVPPSIIYNEYLPALQQDPTVLQRMGLRLDRTATAASTSRSRRASPTRSAASASTSRTSSWSISTTRRTSICSPRKSAPSAMAACGCRIRINTPDPAQHRDAERKYTPEKIRSMYGRSEIDLKFPTPIPVHITYQTAFVDEAGKLQFRKDIYGRDARMMPC